MLTCGCVTGHAHGPSSPDVHQLPRVLITLASLALASPATASPCGWHVDADVRPSIDVHPVRVGGGLCTGPLDITAIVDPLVAVDRQHDLDVVAGLAVGATGWRITAGVRATAIALGDGWSWQDKALLGVTAPLPLHSSHLHATVGLEASLLVVKYGGGIGSEWFSLASGRRFWESYDLGMFVRIAYGSAN